MVYLPRCHQMEEKDTATIDTLLRVAVIDRHSSSNIGKIYNICLLSTVVVLEKKIKLGVQHRIPMDTIARLYRPDTTLLPRIIIIDLQLAIQDIIIVKLILRCLGNISNTTMPEQKILRVEKMHFVPPVRITIIIRTTKWEEHCQLEELFHRGMSTVFYHNLHCRHPLRQISNNSYLQWHFNHPVNNFSVVVVWVLHHHEMSVRRADPPPLVKAVVILSNSLSYRFPVAMPDREMMNTAATRDGGHHIPKYRKVPNLLVIELLTQYQIELVCRLSGRY